MTSWTVTCQAPLSMRFPRQECEVGCHFLLQRIFPIPGSNLCLLLWQMDSLTLSHESEVKVIQLCLALCDPVDYTVHGILQARTLEWVVFPFSRGSFQPRDQTQVSCIASGFFASWAMKEHPPKCFLHLILKILLVLGWLTLAVILDLYKRSFQVGIFMIWDKYSGDE